MNISIDTSCDDSLPDLTIAPDGPGNTYLIRICDGCELTISYEQLESLYLQTRGWFEDGDQ